MLPLILGDDVAEDKDCVPVVLCPADARTLWDGMGWEEKEKDKDEERKKEGQKEDK